MTDLDAERREEPKPILHPWFLALAALTLVIAHVALVWTSEGRGLAMVSARVLLDTDAYMWLNRVLQIHETGDWFEHVFARIDPPEGHQQHWTRPLDGILLVGGSILGLLWGFRDGLYFWGFVLPPFAHVLTLVALVWAIRPLVPRRILDPSGVPLLLLIFLVQLGVFQVFLAGRPDHHALLSLLYALYLGFWLRVMLGRGDAVAPAVGLGVVAAGALWVNVEALLFVALGMLGLALNWILGSSAMGRRGTIHGLVLTTGLAAALVMEWGTGPFPVREMDTLALAHLMLMGLSTAFWAGIWVSSDREMATSPTRRLGIASGAAVLVLGTLVWFFPEFLQDPLGEMDPVYHETRLVHIQELQPLYALAEGVLGGIGSVVLFAGIGLVALPYLVLRVFRAGPSDERVVWLVFGLAVGLYLFLAINQRRWTDYLALSAVIPYAMLAKEVFTKVENRGDGLRARLARMATLLLLVLGPFMIGTVLQAAGTEGDTGRTPEPEGYLAWEDADDLATKRLPITGYSEETGTCDLVQVGQLLSDQTWFSEPALLMAQADYGPELLFRTPHSVLSIPNHRPQPGYRLTRDVMGHPDPDHAASMLSERGVGILVLCARDIEGGVFRFPDPSFAGWLAEGGIPDGYALHASNRFVRIYRRGG